MTDVEFMREVASVFFLKNSTWTAIGTIDCIGLTCEQAKLATVCEAATAWGIAEKS